MKEKFKDIEFAFHPVSLIKQSNYHLYPIKQIDKILAKHELTKE